MYPNGLVDAASIASHTLTLSSCPNIASSFISAMFTQRKVFSMSSASRGEDTDTVGTPRGTSVYARNERWLVPRSQEDSPCGRGGLNLYLTERHGNATRRIMQACRWLTR